MALTINPAVSGVSHRRWAFHVGLFTLGVGFGALITYAVARGLYVALAAISPVAWLAVALPLVGLAVLRDLGLPAPVPYARKQVPEWLRHVLPPGPTAIAYGGQLGTGFLTRFTYSTHAAFIALLAPQSPAVIVGCAVIAFALSKTIVVASSLAGGSYAEAERRVLYRHRRRGQGALRLANAALALAAAAVLATNL